MKRILCFGDSNTWGYKPLDGRRYDRHTRWAAKLAEHDGWEVVEEGLNGRTTVFYDSTEHYRCGLDYAEACVLSHLPLDLIILMLGTNDAKWKYQASAEQIRDGLEQVIDCMRESCARKGQYPKVLIIAPPPLYMWGEDPEFDLASEGKIRALENLYEELAARKDCLFLRASDAVKEIGADGAHMTPEGHQSLAEAVVSCLEGDAH